MKRNRIFLFLGAAALSITAIIAWRGYLHEIIGTDQYKDVGQFPALAKSLYVDFDDSMQTTRYNSKINYLNRSLFSFLKLNYDTFNFNKVCPQQTCKIPKLFHYIWLGKKLPDQYKPFLDTWLKNHPDWTFIFWVDNPENYYLGQEVVLDLDNVKKYLQDNPQNKRIAIDVKHLHFDNRKFFDATRNYGQRSDILKWEVVYRFGGVYIDVDFESIKPLDILHHMYDFYTGVQPLDTNFVQLGAALFGAVPDHPILKHCVETIKDDWHHPQIIVSTGPLHFTKSFCTTAHAPTANSQRLANIALPANYFYPCGYEEQKFPRKNWIRKESFAAHHWAGSWLKPEGWDPKEATKVS